jgi:hypothetical protein
MKVFLFFTNVALKIVEMHITHLAKQEGDLPLVQSPTT